MPLHKGLFNSSLPFGLGSSGVIGGRVTFSAPLGSFVVVTTSGCCFGCPSLMFGFLEETGTGLTLVCPDADES